MQGCPAGVTLMNVGCECDDQAGQQHEPADPDMAEPDHAAPSRGSSTPFYNGKGQQYTFFQRPKINPGFSDRLIQDVK